jgi:hypothetical protein
MPALLILYVHIRSIAVIRGEGGGRVPSEGGGSHMLDSY